MPKMAGFITVYVLAVCRLLQITVCFFLKRDVKIEMITIWFFLLQDTVHSISNFIYVETETATSGGSSSTNEKKSEAAKEDAIDDVDLEGQLMALGERWTVLCTWVEERGMRLSCIRDELELLEREKERLTTWLDKREGVLREMDRKPSDSREDLLRQGQLIAVGHIFNGNFFFYY